MQGLGLGFTSNLSNPRALMEFALGLQQPDGTFHGDPGSMTLDGEISISPARLLSVAGFVGNGPCEGLALLLFICLRG